MATLPHGIGLGPRPPTISCVHPLPRSFEAFSMMASAGSRRGRLVDVFPPGFDSKSSNSRGHYNFYPEQFYRILTENHAPENHVESTVVKSVWYGKQKKAVGHEFMLITVEDKEDGLTNYIVLDRNTSEAPSVDQGAIAYHSQSSRSVALDTFRVSYNGVEEQLLKECQLLPRKYLEKVEFSSTKPLHLYELATLVYIVSERSPNYSVRKYLEKVEFSSTKPLHLYELATLVYIVSERSPNYSVAAENCYWFAGLIWECMLILHPPLPGEHDDRMTSERGRFAMLRYRPERSEMDEICMAYQEAIKLVEDRLSENRERWPASPNTKVRKGTMFSEDYPGMEVKGPKENIPGTVAAEGDPTLPGDKDPPETRSYSAESIPDLVTPLAGLRIRGTRKRLSSWRKWI
ncbi:unnamed protein product [Rhizoctonia solani]|uniref:Uncharacterized protein n=1 Tax=Rhizoctonia solani TaxID=456999 RepID=A0A8H3CU94_9AGAM|nr:unnamed protein product [Rhizoctonia solani]